jgi:hypothetical protein
MTMNEWQTVQNLVYPMLHTRASPLWLVDIKECFRSGHLSELLLAQFTQVILNVIQPVVPQISATSLFSIVHLGSTAAGVTALEVLEA